jgi:hypothetical protein
VDEKQNIELLRPYKVARTREGALTAANTRKEPEATSSGTKDFLGGKVLKKGPKLIFPLLKAIFLVLVPVKSYQRLKL